MRLRLVMMLDQGWIGVWMLPGSSGLCQHSSLPARVGVDALSLEASWDWKAREHDLLTVQAVLFIIVRLQGTEGFVF